MGVIGLLKFDGETILGDGPLEIYSHVCNIESGLTVRCQSKTLTILFDTKLSIFL